MKMYHLYKVTSGLSSTHSIWKFASFHTCCLFIRKSNLFSFSNGTFIYFYRNKEEHKPSFKSFIGEIPTCVTLISGVLKCVRVTNKKFSKLYIHHVEQTFYIFNPLPRLGGNGYRGETGNARKSWLWGNVRWRRIRHCHGPVWRTTATNAAGISNRKPISNARVPRPRILHSNGIWRILGKLVVVHVVLTSSLWISVRELTLV